jgi:hypothetical protein
MWYVLTPDNPLDFVRLLSEKCPLLADKMNLAGQP